jgi:hypothetical protein
MRRTAACSLLEHRRNEDILKELNIDPVVCYIRTKIQNSMGGKKYVERMDPDKLHKQILSYAPSGRRSLGRPKKRWKETVTDPLGSSTVVLTDICPVAAVAATVELPWPY